MTGSTLGGSGRPDCGIAGSPADAGPAQTNIRRQTPAANARLMKRIPLRLLMFTPPISTFLTKVARGPRLNSLLLVTKPPAACFCGPRAEAH